MASMTIATWILAIATLILAIEGGAALRGWLAHLRVGRTRRELDELREQIGLLRHAVWLDVNRGGQGIQANGDRQVSNMLAMDGWRPDPELLEQAGHLDLDRLMGNS